jgi:hypothetical protein
MYLAVVPKLARPGARNGNPDGTAAEAQASGDDDLDQQQRQRKPELTQIKTT